MLAAVIPPGVVCGNKVPTICLDIADDEKPKAISLWLALANSLPFDWLLRRVVTTSVNYFLLRTLAFPRLWIDDLRAERIARLATQIMGYRGLASQADLWRLGNLRAEIDAQVSIAWGLSPSDVDVILRDFPLLDRGERSLPGERRSTVTADIVRLKVANLSDSPDDVIAGLHDRVARAKQTGAVPYRPSEHARRGDANVEQPLEGVTGQ
jgi:hypothetical protein